MIFASEKPVSVCVERIIGYQYFATGVGGYEFYCDKRNICTVSSIVVPSPPVQINGYGMTWKSDFDEESTLVPGLTRYVHDSASHALVAGVVYRDCGEYEIDKSVTVHCGDGAYSFFRNHEKIAQINPYKGGIPWMPMPTQFDYKPYFEVNFDAGIDDEMKLLILSFPMLKFGF